MASIFVHEEVKRRKLIIKLIFSSMNNSPRELSLLAVAVQDVFMYKELAMDENLPIKNGDSIELSSDDLLGVMKNISMVKNGLMSYENDTEQIEMGNGDADSMFTIGDNDLTSFERDLLDNVIGMAEEEVVTQYDDTPTVKENSNKYMNKGKILKERLQKIVSKLQNIQLKTMGKCSTQEIYNVLQSQKNNAIKNIKSTLLKVQKRQSNPFLKSLLCDEVKDGEKVFGMLESQIKTLNEDYDSEATASDSESDTLGETSEEEVPVSNCPLEQRNSYKWLHERASIAYRLTWLVNVMSDIEFKINFYNEALNRYSSHPYIQDQEDESGKRCFPYEPKTQHRMLMQPPLINLAAALKKGDKAKLNRINPCDCYGIDSCPTCVSLKRHSNESGHCLSVDFHPVLSYQKDMSLNISLINELGKSSFHDRHKIKSSSDTDFNKYFMDRTPEQNPPIIKQVQPVKLQNAWPNRNDPITKFNRNQTQSARKRRRMRFNKHKRSRLDEDYKYSSRRSSESICDDDDLDEVYEEDNYDSDPDYSPWFPRTGDKTYNAKREYDIDNIVIPYSIAAASRVEMVKYKEIVTPKWRIVEELDVDPIEFAATIPEPEVVDDLDDGKRSAHHEACEMEERKRFRTMKKQSERTHKNSGHCSSGENTSEALSPLFESRSPMPTVEEEPDAGPSNQDWNQ